MPIRRPNDNYDTPADSTHFLDTSPHLYRYASLDGERRGWMRQLIVESMLYAANPAAFNDPLDCCFTPDWASSALERRQFYRERASIMQPNVPLRAQKRTIERLVRASFTDEGRQELRQRLLEAVRSFGVVCLSRTATSMLMWSHYGDSHRGIAVRFRVDLETVSRLNRQVVPVEVRYADSFPTLRFYRDRVPTLVGVALGTKASCWKHEEELRLLFPGPGSVRIPAAMIDGVVFGMRVSRESEDEVRSWVKGRVPAIELLRVANKAESWDLELVTA